MPSLMSGTPQDKMLVDFLARKTCSKGEDGMRIGITLPNNWGVEEVQSIFRLAVRAEELGFDSVWVSEHIFNVSYVLDRLGSRPYYEPLTILSYVAAITRRVRLGTSVLVLPYHNPINLAKAAATLDVMSGGRLMLGVGVGVIEQEFEAIGSLYAERGAITDEAIAAMKALWTQEEPSFQGKYHSFSGMKFSPKPLQKPYVPLLVGGVSRIAIRRAVAMGNGWHPSTLSPEELGEGMRYLREKAKSAGRDVSELPVSIRLDMGGRLTTTSPATPSGYSLGSDPEEIIRDIKVFESLGVVEIVVSPPTGDTEQILGVMAMMSRDVIPSFG